MLANLWMLKASNGMFWYAVDYIARLRQPTRVIVRPALAALARRELQSSGTTVHVVDRAGFAHEIGTAVRCDRLVYTPSPHPVPFVRRQVVVFHDEFPFEGPKGRLKRALFRFGVRSSGCRVAYINRSVAKPWLLAAGIPATQLLFAPNSVPAEGAPPVAAPPRRRPSDGQVIRLGAFGTDSPKKCYPQLLEALSAPEYRGRIQLCVFGESNDYTRRLMRDHTANPPVLFDPSATSLRGFIEAMDAIVSVASGEGFGRPIATAIRLDKPCYLVESAAFHEFFGGLAWLEPGITELLRRVASTVGEPPLHEPGRGFLAPSYAAAIDEAVAEIGRMA